MEYNMCATTSHVLEIFRVYFQEFLATELEDQGVLLGLHLGIDDEIFRIIISVSTMLITNATVQHNHVDLDLAKIINHYRVTHPVPSTNPNSNRH